MAGLLNRRRGRAAIGLIAAYAIALQALFAALAPLHADAAGVDFGQILCFGSSNSSAPAGDKDGDPAPVAGKFHCVLCVAAAAAVLPDPLIEPAAPQAFLLQFAKVFATDSLAPAPARSGLSRAPPSTL